MLFKYTPWQTGVSVYSKSKFVPSANTVVTLFMNYDGGLYKINSAGTPVPMFDYKHSISRKYNPESQPAADFIKSYAKSFCNKLEHDVQIVGYNMLAVKNIKYNNLKSLFIGFGVLKRGYSLPWVECKKIFKDLSITPAEELYTGKYDVNELVKYNYLNKDFNGDLVLGYTVKFCEHTDFFTGYWTYVKDEYIPFTDSTFCPSSKTDVFNRFHAFP